MRHSHLVYRRKARARPGQPFKRSHNLSLTKLEAGAGFGLRLDTPFGLARIDYGMPVTRRGLEPFGRWHVSLGQAF